jgi:hypothetical protein
LSKWLNKGRPHGGVRKTVEAISGGRLGAICREPPAVQNNFIMHPVCGPWVSPHRITRFAPRFAMPWTGWSHAARSAQRAIAQNEEPRCCRPVANARDLASAIGRQ